MPEWAEVRSFADRLAPAVDQCCLAVSSHKKWDLSAAAGHTVKAVHCHGKFLWWEMTSGACIYNEPLLGGQWAVDGRCGKPDVILTFPAVTVQYWDSDWKKLSKLVWDADGSKVREKLSTLGPDLMAGSVNLDSLPLSKTKRCRWSVGKVLLDQAVVAGIGNYIKCEALYLCHIHPDKEWESLSPLQQAKVLQVCRVVAQESYNKGGSAKYGGGYVCSVFGQRQDPEGRQVEKIKTKDGRQSYICPTLQPL